MPFRRINPDNYKITPNGARTVEVRLPDGRIERRTSKTMSYKWAIVRMQDNWYPKSGTTKREWVVLAWSQTDENAAKTARKWANYGNGGVGLIAAREV